ncbi:DegT/DnrJ/EryC1/StrS family aminotransferase [Natronorarus salvus]|uniref:DegT/DnrJ/EryC1/StrS family aminotransferase n=1 Tax=Natronorarus salvus TaxID=3117733 RepID=UPI002F2617DA
MIPIADPELGAEERERVIEVIESGQIAGGPEVEAFEGEFADYCDAEYAVATTNGTTALHAALVASGIGAGDTVVTTPFSFVATANTIRLTGAEPVFADIDPETYTLDPDATEELIGECGSVDAIMPVHLYGLPAAMDRFVELAEEYDAALIEDAAQAHGAAIGGERVGAIGDAGCFSFYPTKNMTTGEGGMVTTDDEEVATRLRQFVNHGREPGAGYAHVSVGHNFRLTDMAATIGRIQLERLPAFNERRRENAARLTDGLGESVVTPVEPEGYRHVYHQYTVRTEDRETLIERLDDRGVGHGIYYPTCIHQYEAYDGYDAHAPVAERAASEVLSLPVHPNLTEEVIDTVIGAVADREVSRV